MWRWTVHSICSLTEQTAKTTHKDITAKQVKITHNKPFSMQLSD